MSKITFENRQEITLKAAGLEGSATVPKILAPDHLDALLKIRDEINEEIKAGASPARVWADWRERVPFIYDWEFPIGPTLAEMQAGAKPYPEVAQAFLDGTDDLVQGALQRPTWRARYTNTLAGDN